VGRRNVYLGKKEAHINPDCTKMPMLSKSKVTDYKEILADGIGQSNNNIIIRILPFLWFVALLYCLSTEMSKVKVISKRML
jgi:hypothetical protein